MHVPFWNGLQTNAVGRRSRWATVVLFVVHLVLGVSVPALHAAGTASIPAAPCADVASGGTHSDCAPAHEEEGCVVCKELQPPLAPAPAAPVLVLRLVAVPPIAAPEVSAPSPARSATRARAPPLA